MCRLYAVGEFIHDPPLMYTMWSWVVPWYNSTRGCYMRNKLIFLWGTGTLHFSVKNLVFLLFQNDCHIVSLLWNQPFCSSKSCWVFTCDCYVYLVMFKLDLPKVWFYVFRYRYCKLFETYQLQIVHKSPPHYYDSIHAFWFINSLFRWIKKRKILWNFINIYLFYKNSPSFLENSWNCSDICKCEQLEGVDS